MDYSQKVPAVDQAARILYLLADESRGEDTLTEICQAVGIYKSKGRAILNTLREAGLVAKNERQKTFSLGPGLLLLSRALLDRTDLTQAAGPFLEQLAAVPGSCAFLAMIRGDEVFVVARREAPGGMSVTIRVGYHYPLTWGSIGKAIVSHLPEEERDSVLARAPLYLQGEAPGEPLDLQALRQELSEARERGYAQDLGSVQAGLHAVSAPLLFGRPDPRPVGAVTLVGTFPVGDIGRYGERVAVKAREMSLALGPFGVPLRV